MKELCGDIRFGAFASDMYELWGVLWVLSTLVMLPSFFMADSCDYDQEVFFKWLCFTCFVVFLSPIPYILYLRWGTK